MKVLTIPILVALSCCLTAQDSCAEDPDNDGDGWTVGEGDCNDRDESVHPGAEELCDGLDNDCDDVVDEGAIGGSVDCPGVDCAEVGDLGATDDEAFYWIQPVDGLEPLLAWCAFDATDEPLTLYASAATDAALDSSSILTACPAGWVAYRYETTGHVDAAFRFSVASVAVGNTSAVYYLGNSFAGPETNCDSLQILSGYVTDDGSWMDDGIDLNTTYGGFMQDNCNYLIHDPIPMDYRSGLSTTTGSAVLYNSYESSALYPVMCRPAS